MNLNMISILHSLFFQSAGLPQVTPHVVMKKHTIWNMSSQPTSTVVARSVHLGSFLNVSRTQLRLPNPESGRYPVCALKKAVAAMVSFLHSHCSEVTRLKWLPQLIANVDITNLNEVAKKVFITKSHFEKSRWVDILTFSSTSRQIEMVHYWKTRQYFFSSTHAGYFFYCHSWSSVPK